MSLQIYLFHQIHFQVTLNKLSCRFGFAFDIVISSSVFPGGVKPKECLYMTNCVFLLITDNSKQLSVGCGQHQFKLGLRLYLGGHQQL